MRTAGKAAEDLLVDILLIPMFSANVFGVLMCAVWGVVITVCGDLLFDTRWVRLDKLLQSEAPVCRVVDVGCVCCLRTQ